jgi:GDP-4-dehydro-6-deoxy-D-mannose reductase
MDLRILITGACGFVGHHLATHLLDTIANVEIHGTTLPGLPYKKQSNVIYHEIDLKSASLADALIANIRPNHIYHLAAQAFVPRSFEAPWETLENNILAQLNIIQACLRTEIKPRMLIVSSAEIYGPTPPEELPITEQSMLRPTSPYSVSKIAQDMLGLQYNLSHGFPIIRARAFNHIGPGQNQRFVAPDFALQIANIEIGKQPAKLSVGDLTAKRDFTDVRDIVAAYRIIVKKGIPGDVYNICSGKAHSIQFLLDTLLSYSSVPVEVTIDPKRMRPTSIPILVGDNTHLKNVTGWQPKIPFEQTLLDVLDDCRKRSRE